MLAEFCARPSRPPSTIYLNTGSEPWKIVSGTKAYKGLHGKGTEVVDTWYTTPATFVMKVTVSQ
jgi:hypothetical protein